MAQRLARSMLVRYLRLAIPLLPVQLCALLLWNYNIIPEWMDVTADDLHEQIMEDRLYFLFHYEFNGPLYIVDMFFRVPFIVTLIQVMVLGSKLSHRIFLYLMFTLFLGPDSYDFPVILGVLLADLFFSEVFFIYFFFFLLFFLEPLHQFRNR